MTEPDLVVAGAVDEVTENAGNLQLKWQLRPGTVSTMISGIASVVLDGDTNVTLCLSLIGDLGAGDRVHIVQVPPSGNYIVGYAAGSPMLQMASFKGLANSPQSQPNSTFADVLAAGAVAATTTLYKYRNSSRIAYNLAVDAFASAFGDTVEFAFLIDGTDYTAASYFFNAASDHRMIPGASVLTDSEDIPAGTYTVTLRWRNPSGTAANMDSNSQLQFQLYEVAPLPA